MTNKARILFVDDEKRVLNSMRGLFRREYELFLATEGTEAVKIAAANDIDVVVADQRMPGMTGVEVLAKIKEQSPRTVRILLTGYADPSAVEGSINIGEVFRFLSKPCAPKLLRETLSLAISASRTEPTIPQPPRSSARPVAAAPQAPPNTQPAPQVTPAAPPVAQPAPVVHAEDQQTSIRDNDETQPAMRILDEATLTAMDENPTGQQQSITNVVMSEDTVEETQENVALTSANLSTGDVGVVIFTVDSEFAATAIRASSADRSTILATSLVKVAEAIDQKNAGVLVTDFTTNGAILKKIVAALKQRMPHLVTIVVSDGRDTTDMINLINYGQVFRYVIKPVDPEKLQVEISEAVIRHLYLLNNPDSLKRHQVNATPETGDTSRTVESFIGKIRNTRTAETDPADTVS